MPIRAFFKMYEEAIKIEASRYREALDITMATKTKFQYYEFLRSKYNKTIDPLGYQLPEKPADMCMDAGSTEARDAVFSIFRGIKKGFGYV